MESPKIINGSADNIKKIVDENCSHENFSYVKKFGIWIRENFFYWAFISFLITFILFLIIGAIIILFLFFIDYSGEGGRL